MKVHLGIKEVDRANIFLRALASNLRVDGERCGWIFSPFQMAGTREIDIGCISCEKLSGNYSVIIEYENQGGIEFIDFEPSEICDEKKDEELLNLCVSKALEHQKYIKEYWIKKSFRSNHYAIKEYSGRNFAIKSCREKDCFNLLVKVYGFDWIDACSQAQKYSDKVLDILSMATNLGFHEVECTDNEIRSKQFNEFASEKWIDGYRLNITKRQFNYIDKIFESDLISSKFTEACRVFHEASKYTAFKYSAHKFICTPSNYGIDISEIATILYVTVLEILAATVFDSKNKVCDKCGQKEFSIKKKVKMLIENYSDKYMDSKTISGFYDTRSSFVHGGKFFSDRSYSGHTIPQISISRKKVVIETGIGLTELLRLKENTGYLLRKIFEDVICKEVDGEC